MVPPNERNFGRIDLDKKLKVAINAQLMPSGSEGGVVTVLRALTALAWLEDSNEEYVFVGPPEDPEWLRPLLPASQYIQPGIGLEAEPSQFEDLKRALGPFRPVARRIKELLSSTPSSTTPKDANWQELLFESLNCEVVHFPYQSYVACKVPTIYNPHDLQHLHHPEFFSPDQIEYRNKLHPFACRAAEAVVVANQFVKRDVVDQFGVRPERVYVIPWGPPAVRIAASNHESDFEVIRDRYSLPRGSFALYPAMTWPHKNHLRMLEALALVRDRDGPSLRIICTGYKTEFWPDIERRINELDLAELVAFPGLIPQESLNLLYQNSQFVFCPTMFEAASAPLFEAWQRGVAVACSSIETLTEQAGDAALLFDCLSVEDMAVALTRMTRDENLRDDLIKLGHRRLADFSIERTAKTYRALYRKVAGRKLSSEDVTLLAMP
jgi:glycosyltransferase involved in cell wall biosynthesis